MILLKFRLFVWPSHIKKAEKLLSIAFNFFDRLLNVVCLRLLRAVKTGAL